MTWPARFDRWLEDSTPLSGSGPPEVSLGTLLAGEDLSNNWVMVNPRGYVYVRTAKFDYSATAANTEKTATFGIDAEYWTFQNSTSANIWVAFGVTTSLAIPSADTPSTVDMICIPPQSSASIRHAVLNDTVQIRVENDAIATGCLYVIAQGNS